MNHLFYYIVFDLFIWYNNIEVEWFMLKKKIFVWWFLIDLFIFFIFFLVLLLKDLIFIFIHAHFVHLSYIHFCVFAWVFHMYTYIHVRVINVYVHVWTCTNIASKFSHSVTSFQSKLLHTMQWHSIVGSLFHFRLYVGT